ncbi:3-oxo-tetronate kinase [Larsenimonas rhizosphaerae]|uniref:3-oxo-tetronate kinase n=1 Tax=Larsenimonas rhizosphaerae TaxID=2944682 RepID=A0AA41ZF27_9GAMM|nr:3-oxo-tetronate kinase [Larsenimonas rhizosphaerae]MCX2524102.1 four-carbon acid sugar kinase family protein [Larsenimonas rhizosphaerae]
MSLVLGGIADDFTGATDLANNLVRGGMRTVQVIGVPEDDQVLEDADAVIIALKSRSTPVEEAVLDSLAALAWLQARGARQIFFKYCSTFDSTPRGNIGPVAEALMAALDTPQTVMVPAFPVNGRSVYQGHLFVGDRLLNDSGMEQHPLTPMTDADLVRVLGAQTDRPVGLLAHATLAGGADRAIERLASLREAGTAHVICDSVDEQDLAVLAEVTADLPLVTGGSGLAQALPEAYRARGWLAPHGDAAALAPSSGGCAVLSGSCSRMTLAQIEAFKARHPGLALDPLRLSEGDAHRDEALQFARQCMARDPQAPFLIHASADSEAVRAVQDRLGTERAGALVEETLAWLARTLVDEGIGRLIVAGGETSGAVVSALSITTLRIGPQIDPGVPWTQASLPGRETVLSLALKSGNFGGTDFLTRAFEVLP